jgi:hypothetical protein
MAFDIFISYSSKDEGQINPVLQAIKSIQNIRIFFAKETLNLGVNISQEIINAVKNSDIFLVFYSINSVNSNYVQQEIGVAKANNKIIIPVLLDGLKPAAMLTGINYLDLSDAGRYNEGLIRLYNFLKQSMEKKQQSQGLLLLGALGLLAYFASKEDK